MTDLNWIVYVKESDHNRVTELLILIDYSKCNELFESPQQSRWRKELGTIVGTQNAQSWVDHIQSTSCRDRRKSDRMILDVTADYQNAPECVYEDNFSCTKYFYENSLAERIKLLYRIGVIAGELKASEKFDDLTRVTQKQQEVCDHIIH